MYPAWVAGRFRKKLYRALVETYHIAPSDHEDPATEKTEKTLAAGPFRNSSSGTFHYSYGRTMQVFDIMLGQEDSWMYVAGIPMNTKKAATVLLKVCTFGYALGAIIAGRIVSNRNS